MPSPLAVVFAEDSSVRERARDTLARAGIGAVAVATPHEALEVLRVHPFAVVIAIGGEVPAADQWESVKKLCRLRADDGRDDDGERILGRSDAAEALRQSVQELAASRIPVLFTGEAGSGRRHAARCLHALSTETGSFVIAPAADRPAMEATLTGAHGTVFVASIEDLPWPEQETLAAALASATAGPRIVASTAIDPRVAADQGRLSPSLLAAFGRSIVRVPPLRERRPDIAVLVRAFIEQLCRLNDLPPLAVAPGALMALEAYAWPGNVKQLRGAIEAAVILATDGVVRATDLPAYVFGEAGLADPDGRADRRFRDAKRSVVEAFERAYLGDLLKRHQGNVTGAADQSGMLRSALQRLLRKHGLHSADFRRLLGPGPHGT